MLFVHDNVPLEAIVAHVLAYRNLELKVQQAWL